MNKLIPQSFINDLLERTNIIDIINACINLKKIGKNYNACCPFHEEKTPSFNVNHEKQFYYCFGCGATGNAINFIMQYQQTNFPDAVKTLADKAGMEIPKDDLTQSKQEKKLQVCFSLINQVTDFYSKNLYSPAGKLAREYLQKRKLSTTTIKNFNLGFAPLGWHNLQKFFLAKSANKIFNLKNFQLCGLMVKSEHHDYYDRFRDRIIFPIKNIHGQIIGFGGRTTGHDKPKYLNSPETLIFHKSNELYGLYEAKKNHNSLIVVEGYMDVLSLIEHGINNVVATLGTNTTVQHLNKLFNYTKKIIFCFDGDNAGYRGAQKALKTILPIIKDDYIVQFLFLPKEEDPDSLITNHGVNYFKKWLATKPKDLDQFLIIDLLKNLDIKTINGKLQFIKQANFYINLLKNSNYKHLLIKEIAKQTGIEESLITNQQPKKNNIIHESNNYSQFRPQYSKQFKKKPEILATLSLRAIRILHKHPHLAENIALDTLKKSIKPEIKWLIEFAIFLQQSQQNNWNKIYGSLHNTALGDILLKANNLDIPEDENQNESRILQYIINTIIQHIRKQETTDLPPKKKLAEYSKKTIKRVLKA